MPIRMDDPQNQDEETYAELQRELALVEGYQNALDDQAWERDQEADGRFWNDAPFLPRARV